MTTETTAAPIVAAAAAVNTLLVPGAPHHCRECGGSDLSWFAHVRVKNDVVQNRLNTHDTECVFVLGCDECSETLHIVKADAIADLLATVPAEQPAAATSETGGDAGDADQLLTVAQELDRLSLVIESAVRQDDPQNHAAVLSLIKSNQSALAGRQPSPAGPGDLRPQFELWLDSLRLDRSRHGDGYVWNDVELAWRAIEKFAGHQPASQAPMEMRICELRHVALKPNRPYIFTVDVNCATCREDAAYALGSAEQAGGLGYSFQAGVAAWMGKCFLQSLYSNMTERGDRLLEETLELLQAHGYDPARVATLVGYVFGRPVGEPAQEVGGVMVTLAAYCAVAGLDMQAAGDAELARINLPEVMAKVRAKQETKNALHFDTPLPGNAAASA